MGVDAFLFFQTSAPAEVVHAWGWHVAERFGRDSWIPVGSLPVRADTDDHAGGVYEVDLGGMRYYGKGYERGDIVHVIAVAELLEHLAKKANHPIEIRYGGDTLWEDSEVFDGSVRADLYAHFLEVGHQPYRHHDRHGRTMCHACGVGPIGEHGGGGGYDIGACDGCGAQFRRERSGYDAGPWERDPAREGDRGTFVEESRRLSENLSRLFKRDPSLAATILRSLGDELDGVAGVPPDVLNALKIA